MIFEKPLRATPETKTVLVGLVTIRKKHVIKYLIRKEKDMFSVCISSDDGYSARLLPRISCDTDESCYHTSVEAAREWIEDYEARTR